MSNSPLKIYMTYSFLRLLTQPWVDTDAFKLGIIDKTGVALKKAEDLKTSQERDAYTVWHRLVFKLKRLLDKIPFGKTLIGSYAAALWLIKENVEARGDFEDILENFCKLYGFKLDLQEAVDESGVALEPGLYAYTGGDWVGHNFELKESREPVGNILGVDVYQFAGVTFTRSDVFPIEQRVVAEEVTGVTGQAGVQPGDEPPGRAKKPVRRSKFAGMDVFDCNDDVYHRCKLGKVKYHRYDKYVGDDETGQEIRDFGLKNPKSPIILRHEKSGSMLYLRHPSPRKGW